MACGSRSRSPGVMTPTIRLRSRARSSAASSARANSSLNSTSTPGVCRSCSEIASSMRPRATCFAISAADVSFDGRQRLGHSKLHIQMPMVQRTNRHADRRPIVLARHGRKPRHRFDHVGYRVTLSPAKAGHHTRRVRLKPDTTYLSATYGSAQPTGARSCELPAAASRRATHTCRWVAPADRHGGRPPRSAHARGRQSRRRAESSTDGGR